MTCPCCKCIGEAVRDVRLHGIKPTREAWNGRHLCVCGRWKDERATECRGCYEAAANDRRRPIIQRYGAGA